MYIIIIHILAPKELKSASYKNMPVTVVVCLVFKLLLEYTSGIYKHHLCSQAIWQFFFFFFFHMHGTE